MRDVANEGNVTTTLAGPGLPAEKIERRPSGSPFSPAEDSHTKALYDGAKEAVLIHGETSEELARVPWWAGDDAVEEGNPVTVDGRRYRVAAWGGRWVGRPAYVFVEPARLSDGPTPDLAEAPNLDTGREAQ